MALADTIRFILRHPIGRRQKLRALGRFVRWQLESRFKTEVVVPWVGTTRLVVRRGMTGATGNIYVGLHEFRDMAFVLHVLRQGDVFADVGANIGSYSVLASGVCGARSVAFEPDPEASAVLRKNMECNGISDLVDVREVALGSSAGTSHFTVGLDTTNHVTDSSFGTRIVATDTLDRVFSSEAPTLIKIDVEGHEEHVLSGAQASLASPTLLGVISENQSTQVEAILFSAGFIKTDYDPFARRLRDNRQQESNNGLYVRNIHEIEARVKRQQPFVIFDLEI